ncbi:MAG: rRNA (adenine-N(6)-)-methyltransferase [candidate division WS6 bacterium 36_33]|uniref:rRNA (Adenine-N(6)-)-methyltransferase n=1 Tax=candidate division WS6 bacterium 36_33 TaxID=1641388 RepID=A0A101H010_9BACT|nr:MAG: rRNA (adenine-N(6)-)-methyltransferase [candidate division WS6 bacterium 36_33]
MDDSRSNSKDIGESLSYSQNFLRKPQFVSSLVDMSDITVKDTVIEIGAGKGRITEQLLKRAGKVIAIEYDSKLAQLLIDKFSNTPNVKVVETDFFSWPLPSFRYKVFSNIPFEYTSRILDKLLLSANPSEDTYLIMQDLAAKRFMGKVVGADDSQVSILLQPFYSMSILKRIDRRQYSPMPSVDTVLARFEKRKYPLVDFEDTQEYRDFVIYGYNQWKPTILEAFKNVFSYKQTKIIKQDLEIEGKKPSDLDVDTWVELFKKYRDYVPEEKKSKVRGSEEKLKEEQSSMKKEYRTRK